MKLKRFENIDIEPFEEDDWDDEEFDISKNEENYWVVKKMGDDRIYFTKQIKVPLKIMDNGIQFYDQKYQVLERDFNGNHVFSNRYTTDNQSIILLSKKEMYLILNDKLEVNYLDTYVRYKKLSEICAILNVDKDYIKFKHK